MSRPSPIDSRLADWLQEGPTSGPDDGLTEALARVHSVGQRPAWLDRMVGDTMETTWRAPMTWSPRLAFTLIVFALLAALTAGAIIVGSLPRSPAPQRAVAGIPPTSCGPASTLASGTIATITGTGVAGSTGDGRTALDAQVEPGQGIVVGPEGAIYFGDAEGAIRKITPDGTIDAWVSGIKNPGGLGFDADGNLYVTSDLSRIVRVARDKSVTPVAGTGVLGSAGDEGPATEAIIGAATLGVAPDGQLYFDDTGRYRTVDAEGIIHNYAGNGTYGLSGDGGPATQAQLGNASFGIVGVAVMQDGSVLLGDPGNLRIRRVDPAGIISTYFASTDLRPSPYGLAIDTDGALYIADWQAASVFRVANGTASRVAGKAGLSGNGGDCGPAMEAFLNGPAALTVHDGAVYILDQGGSRIRVIVP